VRKALNENPLVQIGLIAVLALVVGVMLLTRMGGHSATSSATDTTATTPAAPGVTTPAGTTPAPAAGVPGAASAGSSTLPPSIAPAPEAKFVAGPGLPARVVNAYATGKTVVLLVVRRGGIDDRILQAVTQRLHASSDLAVFIVPARHVAQYARITEGVDLNRVPALVVLRPKRLTHGPTPRASVSYGFRSVDSVLQAIRDAAYHGANNLPYYPR
jgi:hypothetical protein